MMTVADIAKISEIAKAHNALLAIDNTFLSPYFQRPIELGADIVVNEGDASKWSKEEPAMPWYPVATFAGQFDGETVARWLKVFTRRLFTQQFKRSCMPDGPAVCDVSVSPRGGLSMPSDACMNLWMQEIENI